MAKPDSAIREIASQLAHNRPTLALLWVTPVSAQELSSRARFRCHGQIISATETADGGYDVVAQITFELETEAGQRYRGGGLALGGEASASPDGNFRCRGRGQLQAQPMSVESQPETALYQIALEASRFRVQFEEGSAEGLTSLTILGLGGEAAASPDGT